jgi:phage baseplate assembly protein W
MSVYFGPTTYTETDTTTSASFPWTLLKSIPVDFSAMPTGQYGLSLAFTAGEIQTGPNGFVLIVIGGTATDLDSGVGVWTSQNLSGAPASVWASVTDLFAANPAFNEYGPANFTNPNPSGTSYIKIFGYKDAGDPDPTGIRNFTFQIQDRAASVIAPIADAGTYTTTLGHFVLLKSIPVDFTGLPAGLRIVFTDGEIETNGDGDAGLKIIIGGGAADLLGTTIWENYPVYGGGLEPITNALDFNDTGGSYMNVFDFRNPNSTGTSYIKLVGKTATNGDPPAGFSNFIIEILSSPSPPTPACDCPELPVTPPLPAPAPFSGTTLRSDAGADPLGAGIIRPFHRTEHQDFATGSGVPLVISCLVQVLGTPLGSLPWEPGFGSMLYRLRHRSQDPTFLDLARVYSDDAIKRWEPRASVVRVEIEPSKVSVSLRNSVGIIVSVRIGDSVFKASIKI